VGTKPQAAKRAQPAWLYAAPAATDVEMSNPLLELQPLPPFSRIRTEHVEPAVAAVLGENEAALERLLDEQQSPTWDSLMAPLDELRDRLHQVWSPVAHLNAVVNSEALRASYNACLPKLSAYWTELGQNERLQQAVMAISDDASANLDPARLRALENNLRDFHLSGVDLPAMEKARYKAVMQELSALQSQFEDNVLDATNAWTCHLLSDERLAGLPDSARAVLRQNAERRGLEGWLITLEFPSYFPVMSYADNRELRRQVYEAFVTRASDQGPQSGDYDNGELMERILGLRHELARLLGFASYAERSLATKMAASVEQVLEFLEDLAARSRPQAEQEFAELAEFAREEHRLKELAAWDVSYYSEKLRRQRYALSQEDLRPYFPETRVLPGLFAVVERLYGVRVNPAQGADLWHPDVRFYELRDAGGKLRAHFYMDLFARAKKRGGAWMDEYRGRRHTARGLQTPVAFVTCNFTPPVGDRPALFTHDEVLTLFHEFGHALHHMLTRVDCYDVSGINGVEWDAVELPSQFMENWCWEREALALIAGHHETGEPLPEPLYERMLAARNFQSAMMMVRQLEFALFDFRLHAEYRPEQGGRVLDIWRQVRDQVAVVPVPAFNRFPNAFSHIFAGGYAAGYYSYKWAEVLSADAFSRFEEEGIFNRQTGQDFLRCVLEVGGSRNAMDSFIAFRGREPEVRPLLRHSGIAA
jgi:oligopeptidase A